MQAEPSPLNQNIAIIQRVRMMCDLFNLAFEMKSLELERQHRDRNRTVSRDRLARGLSS